MTKNNSTNLSLWKMFLKRGKKILKSIQKSLRDFSQKYPDVSQIIQLTFIYFFAVIDLMYAVLNNVFSLGYLPEILIPFFPLIKAILQSPILKIWASPEKVFFLSYVVIEFMVVRSTFKFSKLVLGKILAHWLVTGLPLVIIAPLLAILLGLSVKTISILLITLLLGTPVLSLIGAIGVALTVGLRRGGMILSLLVLPLYVPVLIFAANAVEMAQLGLPVMAQINMLAAMLVLACVLAPWPTAAALKMSMS